MWFCPDTARLGIHVWRAVPLATTVLSKSVPDCLTVGVVDRFWISYQRAPFRPVVPPVFVATPALVTLML